MIDNCKSSQNISFALVNLVKCFGKEGGVGKITGINSMK